MVDLTSHSPLVDQKPVEIGSLTLSQGKVASVHSIAPFKDRHADVSGALSKIVGVPLSQVGCMRVRGDVEVFWTGLNQWFVVGGEGLSALKGAAVTDQSDAWAILEIRGNDAKEVLARLCPLDLRSFEIGQVARSEFAHMMSIVIPRDGGFDVWIMRSFAQTAWHHLKDAALSLEAQSQLRG